MSGAIPLLPRYAFMAWCSVKTQEQLYFYLAYFILWQVFVTARSSELNQIHFLSLSSDTGTLKDSCDCTNSTYATAAYKQPYEPPSCLLCLLVCIAEGDFLPHTSAPCI